MPSTFWSVPMSGVHMALRTLWMRIDFPLNRSSAAVLSDRMATRSSTTLRAIDCGTCFEADDCAVRRFRTGELGRHRGHDLRPRHGGADLLHTEGDLAEGDDVVFDGDRLGDAGAVQEGPVRGAGVLDLHAAVGEGHLGMAAGNGGVVNRDVAGHGAPDDDVTTRLQVDGLLARRAQQLEHRRQIYFTLRPWRAPTP